MEGPTEESRQLMNQANEYASGGDDYNAIKLCKRAIRLSPGWLPPYECLCRIYKRRREWKAVLHYNKKIVAIDPARPGNWWDVGLGAAATGRFRLARSVWSKFGQGDIKSFQRKPVIVQLIHSGLYELVLARPLDPVRVVLESIPHPKSDRTFRDVLLIGHEEVGTTIVGNRRLSVYPELDLLKRSHFQTWSCILEQVDQSDIHLMEDLCRDAIVGMEVWSNANRAKVIEGKHEYYASNGGHNAGDGEVVLALAARREQHIRNVLSSWKVIALKSWRNLERHV